MDQQQKIMAVLFDMDGVIVLSNKAHQLAWEAFSRKKLGQTITNEMFYQTISGRKNEDALSDLFPGRFSPTELTQIANEKEAYYRESFGPYLEDVPGVLNLIHTLSAQPSTNVRIALATSGPPENVAFIVKRFNILNAFPVIVDGSQVTHAKPNPTIYLKAAEQSKVQPENCVVLEDAVAGVQAAKRAGMRCLAVTTSETEEALRKAGADVVYPDFTNVSLETLTKLLV